MADDKAVRPASRRGGRYNTLILFWAVVLSAGVVGAVFLQALGPVGPAATKALDEVKPIADAAQAASGITAPDMALQEAAPDFAGHFLPQIGPGERTPARVYAAPFDPADKHPRVALVVAGAGLDQDQTRHLLNDLPGAIDVAFSAYMPEAVAEKLAARARATGHECLQSIPMEPTGYPLAEEGNHALLTGAEAEQNRVNLEFALSRVTGCAGATGASDGLLGERYAQTGLAFGEVLSEVAKRGLIYLDPRTGAPALATAQGPVQVADLVVDAPLNPDQPVTATLIDQQLAVLEKLAATRGHAVGLAGPPRPILLERIAVWSRGLAARGIALAPLTAMPLPPKAVEEQ